jgi:hypothetical protein
LFFRTPFGLGQICDWQDQAILITRLGEERAVQFRKQLGICLASELALLARQYLDSEAREQEETAAQLNLGNRLSVHTTLTRFASDESIALLALYRLASPKNADFAAGRAEEPLRSQTFLGSAAQ